MTLHPSSTEKIQDSRRATQSSITKKVNRESKDQNLLNSATQHLSKQFQQEAHQPAIWTVLQPNCEQLIQSGVFPQTLKTVRKDTSFYLLNRLFNQLIYWAFKYCMALWFIICTLSPHLLIYSVSPQILASAFLSFLHSVLYVFFLIDIAFNLMCLMTF